MFFRRAKFFYRNHNIASDEALIKKWAKMGNDYLIDAVKKIRTELTELYRLHCSLNDKDINNKKYNTWPTLLYHLDGFIIGDAGNISVQNIMPKLSRPNRASKIIKDFLTPETQKLLEKAWAFQEGKNILLHPRKNAATKRLEYVSVMQKYKNLFEEPRSFIDKAKTRDRLTKLGWAFGGIGGFISYLSIYRTNSAGIAKKIIRENQAITRMRRVF